tara:strand:+ start:1229 stop:1402 length:174 start_codon:yes stop_codon:yes gene_type:complete
MFFYIYNWLFGTNENEYERIKKKLKKTKTLKRIFYIPKKSELVKQILIMKKRKTTTT